MFPNAFANSDFFGSAWTTIARARQFEEELLVCDVPGGADCAQAEPLGDLDEVYAALTLGLRDYVEKNGFKEIVIGLSGGIDSALTAALAVDALGADKVRGVMLPFRFTAVEVQAGLTVDLWGYAPRP